MSMFKLQSASTSVPVPAACWSEFFRANALTPTPVEWTAEAARLTTAERGAIAASVAEFQLGESSEGSNLLRFGRHYAEATGDAAYFTALRLFIGEEHRHARDLGRFMDLAGLPRLKQTWGDSTFRFLRRRAGLEGSIVVLVTAELVATVYYEALRDATRSSLLRGLCVRILADEAKHVQFQCERLAILRRKRNWAGRTATAAVHHLLMAGACLMVWQGHRHAFRRGGFGFGRYAAALCRALRHGLRIADPKRYRFLATDDSTPDRACRPTVASIELLPGDLAAAGSQDG